MEQRAIYSAVDVRGYIHPYATPELITRQGVKMVEELAEVLAGMAGPPEVQALFSQMQALGRHARRLFDNPDIWQKGTCSIDARALEKELPDLQVILCVAAEALNRVTDGPFDVIREAERKATRDITRGVR